MSFATAGQGAEYLVTTPDGMFRVRVSARERVIVAEGPLHAHLGQPLDALRSACRRNGWSLTLL